MRLSVRRPIVIGVVAAILVGSGVLASGLRMDEDITALLPSSDPVVSDYRLVVTRFKALESIFVDIGAERGSADPTSDVIAAADAMADSLGESDLFEKVNYRIAPEQAAKVFATLASRRASLLSQADCERIEGRLSLERIRERLQEAKRALIEPSGPFVRDHLRQDPLGFNELLLEKLHCLSRTGTASISDGRIWSGDSRHVLMIVTARSAAMDTARGVDVIAAVERARQEALGRVPPGTVRISYIGGHRAALDNAQTIKADVQRSLTVTSIGILALGMLFFRRRSFVALMFLPALFGLACSAIGFALFSSTVSAVTIGCSALLIGISVDYGIHLLYRLDNDPSASATPFGCARSVLLPLAMGACTTIGGLLCLVLVSLPGQQQVGVWGAVGVLGAAVFTALALPFFVPSVKSPRRPIIPLANLCDRFLAWRDRHKIAFLIVGVATLALGLVGLPHVAFEGDVTKMNYLHSDSRLDEERIHDVWGGFSLTSVVVRGRTRQEALAANDRLYDLLQELRAKGKISHFTSISPILPASSTQEANRRCWRTFWSEERRQIVGERIAQVSKELGFAPGAFSPFQEALAESSLPVAVRDFDGIGLDAVLDSHVAEAGGECVILNTITIGESLPLDEVTALIHSAVPGTIVMDRRHFVEHIAGLVRSDVRTLALAAGIVMSVCLLLFLRRIELVLAVFLPVLFSFVVTMGLLGLAGISINLISCLFIVFVFGVGIDYSIFLLNSALDTYRGKGEHRGATFGAVIICVLSTLCGFAALAVADHPALFSIGITGMIGMLSSLLAAVIVVPMVTALLLPKEGRYGTPSIKTWFGGLLAIVYVATTCILYLVVLRPLVYLRHRKDIVARQRFARRCCQRIAFTLLRYFPYRSSQCVYIGLDGNSLDRPAVIVANHASVFDIFGMLSLPSEMVMMVKQWVWRWPIVGSMVRSAGYVLVDDRSADDLLQRARDRLSEGAHVMIFPEGSRSPSGQMRRFHKGAFELAIRARADIVPVLITNSQACIPYKSAWVGDHRTVIRVLPRVGPETFDYNRDSRQLAQHVKKQMLERQSDDWQLAQEGRAFWRNILSLYSYRGAFVESYVAWKLRLDPIFRRIDEFVPEVGLVIDAGCGYGLMSNVLARKSLGRKIFGVDMDPGKIRVARRTALAVPNTTFVLGNLLDMEYPEAEAVILVDTLHYWSEDKQRDIMAKACDALRPGGVMVFRDAYEASGWRHRLTRWAECLTTAIGHNRRGDGLYFFGEDFYLRAFESSGLVLQDRPRNMGRGSNQVLILRKNM